MPFVGEVGGNTVVPEEVQDGTTVICTACGARMRPRGPFTDDTARHFFHLSDSTTCQGGESDTHRKWKSLATSALRTQFAESASTVGVEELISVSDTQTPPNERYADSFVRFSEPHQLYGDGLAVEVQYKNVGKDVQATTHDYLSNNISVYWADSDDFTQDRFLFENLKQAFKSGRHSPQAFAAPHDIEPPATGPEPVDKRDPSWLSYDPRAGCRHEFINSTRHGESHNDRHHQRLKNQGTDAGHRTIEGNGFHCLRCGIRVAWKEYPFYEKGYIVSKHSIKNEYIPPDITDRGVHPSDHYHIWVKPTEMMNAIHRECVFDCGAVMVDHGDRVTIDHGD